MRETIAFIVLGALAILPYGQALDLKDANGGVGRRAWIQQAAMSSGSVAATVGGISAAIGLPVTNPWTANAVEASSSTSRSRDALLQAIQSNADDEMVLKRLDELVADPQQESSGGLLNRIDGKWKLIWSIDADKFSPLLQLPPPFKPTSYQYIGSAAAPIVGDGRIAQMLTNGILGSTKTWLSSGVVDVSKTEGNGVLQIRPPFRLEVETSPDRPRKLLTEAGSDADFRAVNVRSVEAQQAPPNLYRQLYCEDIGPGSLRISKIIDGDPVIVGATFIHVLL